MYYCIVIKTATYKFNHYTLRFMKKQIFLNLVFVIIISNCSFAQEPLEILPPGYTKVISPAKLKGVDGSPFLSEDWKPGVVNLINGNSIKGLTYRYNVYRNEMSFLYQEKEYAIGAPDSIKEMNLSGQRFIFGQVMQNNIIERSFFEVATEGKATLLVKYYIEVIPANFNVALNSGNPNDQIVVKERYCLKLGGNIVPIDKKGKLILTALSDKKTELAEFIDKEDISLKRRDGLLKVISYYNTL